MLSDEKIVEYLNVVESLLSSITEELVERQKREAITKTAWRVLACLEVPKTTNEIAKSIVVDYKILKLTLDFLLKDGAVVCKDGYFRMSE